MPAITVDDLTALPRVPAPAPALARERPVVSLTSAPRGFEGEGFPVRRAFQGVPMTKLDPFIHMDQMGEVEYAPGEPKGTPWHPHRGFETVTYMMDGTFEHSDSNGGGGVITNGDTQWMTGSSWPRSTPWNARRTGKPSPSNPRGALVTLTTARSRARAGPGVRIRGRTEMSSTVTAGMDAS